jgi:hypothetical protein
MAFKDGPAAWESAQPIRDALKSTLPKKVDVPADKRGSGTCF